MTESTNATAADTTVDPELAAAIAAWHAGDPDSVPVTTIRAAYRDLNCRESGPECYRRVIYPGRTEPEWPDSDRLTAPGHLAADRRCTVHCEVPVGTLVLDYERQVFRGRRGRCSVTIGLVAARDGKGVIHWLKHRTLRKRPVYEVTMPDGSTVDVPRRER
jgi:hypothetical protein